jgi:hypothetical protein
MDNVIKFTQTQVAKTVKYAIIIAFILGGWFTTLEARQWSMNDKAIEHELRIKAIEEKQTKMDLFISTSLIKIQNTVDQTKIFSKSTDEKVKDIVKDLKNK